MAPGAIKSDEKPAINMQGASNDDDSKPAFNAATIELQTKGSGQSGSKEGLGGGRTFARQHELPKLPIPKLKDTCQRYLTSLQPLQNEKDHEKSKKVVEEFLNNEGPKLQSELESYASDKASYIEQWWDGECRFGIVKNTLEY